jgi:hypothetical protein
VISSLPEVKFTEGVHCQQIRYEGCGRDLADRVVSLLNSVGLLAALEQFPLESLELLPFSHAFNRIQATGSCTLSGDLRLYHQRPSERLGHPLEAGVTPWLSYSAADDLSALQITLVHELGHHFFFCSKETQRLWSRAAPSLSPCISAKPHLLGHTEEHFAETFCAYFCFGEVLQGYDPAAYATIKKVSELLGVRHA